MEAVFLFASSNNQQVALTIVVLSPSQVVDFHLELASIKKFAKGIQTIPYVVKWEIFEVVSSLHFPFSHLYHMVGDGGYEVFNNFEFCAI